MSSHYADTLRRLRDRIAQTPERRVVRQLDSWVAALDAAPEAAQERIARAVAVVRPELAAVLAVEPTGPLCPAFDTASSEHQARVVLGEKPAQILRGLTPREAHSALVAGYTTAVGWILDDSGLPPDVRVSSVAVARWLAACWRDPARKAALQQEREGRVAGEVVRGACIWRVDEIRVVDLDQGERTSIRRAFERAAERLYREWEELAQDDHDELAPAPRWWRPVRCAKLLRTKAALVAEGRVMQHCVGSYAVHVAKRRSVVVSIAIRVGAETHRSTAELDPITAEVRQHKGVGNAKPHVLCSRALEVLERRWRP